MTPVASTTRFEPPAVQIFDGVFHVWQMLDGLVPEARVALRQAAAFINDPVSS